MKKALFIVFVYALAFLGTSCGNKTKKQTNQETHVHQDGTIHEGAHHHENEEASEQESFVVGEDSTETQEHHEHDNDHDHDHGHEH
jgi:hydrogenase nickel incorporation protein HypB